MDEFKRMIIDTKEFVLSTQNEDWEEEIPDTRFKSFREFAAIMFLKLCVGDTPMGMVDDLSWCMCHAYLLGIRDGTPVPEAFKEE